MADNKDKIILDLCGGTGSWSKPYRDAGYDVRLITLPDNDVCTYIPPKNVYGILAAPPCTEFSFAKSNAKYPRDMRAGMETVEACLKIIWQCQYELPTPLAKRTSLVFWALENPFGLMRRYLGKPPMIFNPYDFGDPYQKKTCLWGFYNFPKKKPLKIYSKKFIHHMGETNKVKFDKLASKDIHPERFGELDRQARRSITPAGFANAFFKANQ